MDNTILRDIIEVEKEIQQSVDKARDASREWLVVRKQEISQNLAREEQELAASYQKDRENLIREAEKKSSEMLRRAEQEHARMTHLQNDTLAAIVSKEIRRILPE